MQNSRRLILQYIVYLATLATGTAARAQDAVQPYLGEIMLVSFGFAPKNWAECNGQLLPISQNQALFSLLGTTYGGNGTTTFALPDLRGRIPVHAAARVLLGERGGEESHVLIASELPAHTHAVRGDSAAGTSISPLNNYPARDAGSGTQYSSGANSFAATGAVTSTGGGQSHENRMPYLGLRYIISLQGLFPTRN